MVIGCLISGAVGRLIGRRWSIVMLVIIALIGMVIQNVIHYFWAVMAGRMVNAISMGIEANVGSHGILRKTGSDSTSDDSYLHG